MDEREKDCYRAGGWTTLREDMEEIRGRALVFGPPVYPPLFMVPPHMREWAEGYVESVLWTLRTRQQ
jgi:hypothetical protein